MTEQMSEIKNLRRLFENASNDYLALKNKAEAQVVNRRWASTSYINLEPFYFELHGFSRGKILKESPKNLADTYDYGFDAQERVVLVKQYADEERFYEDFYFYGQDEVLGYRFDYYDKKCVSVQRYVYEGGLLVNIYSAFIDNGYWIKNFIYSNAKLAQKQWRGIDRLGAKIDRDYFYEYDELGKLNSITLEGGYVCYKKPDKKTSYKKLYELAAQRLLSALKETIKMHAPSQKLYCINLAYDGEVSLPPIIGFGTQKQREELCREDKSLIIWNVADYEFSTEINEDDETAKIFGLFNQETQLNDRYLQAKKLILECAKQLKADICELEIDATPDFVIVASYHDLGDLRKNFKAINPELISEYKGLI